MPRRAYVTMLTNDGYLPAVLVLARTLRNQGSIHPLHVMYTSNLSDHVIQAMEEEAPSSLLKLDLVERLLPRGRAKTEVLEERFNDVWTKLRIFSPLFFHYDKVCFLDADMIIINRNMDLVFEVARDLKPGWIGACHECLCNYVGNDSAPFEWQAEDCPWYHVRHPAPLTHSEALRTNGVSGDNLPKLNAGMIVLSPDEGVWKRMLHALDEHDHITQLRLPEQDFMAEFFESHWIGIGWQFNALKTHRVCHPLMWHDNMCICVHFTFEKPWANKSGKNRDGSDDEHTVTHGWWRREYKAWQEEKRKQGQDKLLEVVDSFVTI